MHIPIVDEQRVFKNILSSQKHYTEEYYAFYSSWFGGIVKHPGLMLLPMDDHMVHRGDGSYISFTRAGKFYSESLRFNCAASVCDRDSTNGSCD